VAAFTLLANQGLKDASGGDIPMVELAGEESSLFEDDHLQATRTIVVAWVDAERTIQGVLGYSAKNAAAPTGLHRVLPAPHPKWYWLWAKRLDGPTGITGLGAGSVGQGGGPAAGMTYNNYKYAKFKVLYESLPFVVVGDNQCGADESGRYVEVKFDGEPMLLTSDRGQYSFNDAGTANTNAIKGPVGYPLSKGLVKATWYNVDLRYVSDGTIGIGLLNNIHPLMNTVNSAAFLGYPAGTLRMGKPVVRPVTAPVNPQTMGLAMTAPARMVTIELNMQWFDPPRGTSAFRGHILWPDPTSAVGNWYRATTPAGRTLFQSASWANVFKSV
jgi:hypothetical protein